MKQSPPDVLFVAAGEHSVANRMVRALRAVGVTVADADDPEVEKDSACLARVGVFFVDRHIASLQAGRTLSEVGPGVANQPWVVVAKSPDLYANLVENRGGEIVVGIELGAHDETMVKLVATLRNLGIDGFQIDSGKPKGGNSKRQPPTHWSCWVAGFLLITGLALAGGWVYFNSGATLRPQERDTVSALAAPTPASEPPPAPKPEPTPEPQLAPQLPANVGPFLPASLEAKALAHVFSALEESSRTEPADAGRLALLADKFSDPVYIEGKGSQSRSGLLASLQLRQQNWPVWSETPQVLEVQRLDDKTVIVSVKSRYRAENQQNGKVAADLIAAKYTVVTEADGRPLITRVEQQAADSKP